MAGRVGWGLGVVSGAWRKLLHPRWRIDLCTELGQPSFDLRPSFKPPLHAPLSMYVVNRVWGMLGGGDDSAYGLFRH